MQPILITGTLAYDILASHSEPGSQIPRNIKLDHVVTAFGGCAGNIAASLKWLGDHPVPIAAVGLRDYERYREHLRDQGISEAGVVTCSGQACPRGFIFTAPDQSQLTAFYPGPPAAVASEPLAQRLTVLIRQWRPRGVIVTPDQPETLDRLSGVLEQTTTPMVWSPGQYAAHLPASLVRRLAMRANVILLNQAEYAELQTGLDDSPALRVITDGAHPVTVSGEDHVGEDVNLSIPVPAAEALDPTGCGDAFTAAFTRQWLQHQPLPACVNAGISQAQACLAHPGAQTFVVNSTR